MLVVIVQAVNLVTEDIIGKAVASAVEAKLSDSLNCKLGDISKELKTKGKTIV